jgi:hypothetical protein
MPAIMLDIAPVDGLPAPAADPVAAEAANRLLPEPTPPSGGVGNVAADATAATP